MADQADELAAVDAETRCSRTRRLIAVAKAARQALRR
jgi:hypothetical protein